MKWENLLFNLVQIGLTVSAVALVLLCLRRVLKKRYPARVMCAVWAVLAVRLLIPVQLTLPEPPVQVTPRTHYVLHEAVLPAQAAPQPRLIDPADTRWVTGGQAAQFGTNDPASVTTFNVGSLLAALWLLGALCFAAAQAELYLRYNRRLRRCARQTQSDMLRRTFDEQKQTLGVTRDVLLRISPEADCPMLAGFFRPALYLPDENLNQTDAAFIFRHELTHYKRGDLWLKLLLVLARAVQWFNPLIHCMAHCANEDIELACDDAVAKDMDGAQRRAYGETILRSAERQVRRRALVSCFTGDKETLMHRFEGLFDKKAKKRGVALVLAVCVLIGTLGCAFSVGGDDGKLTADELTVLGEQWMGGNYRDAEPWYQMLTADLAQELYDRQVAYGEEIGEAGGAVPGEPLWRIGTSSPYVDRFTVLPDAENRQAVVVTEWGTAGEIPVRQAERIHFQRENGEWKVDRVEGNPYINDTPFVSEVDSIEDFRLLYENDLGLPDNPDDGSGQHAWENPPETTADPVRAAAATLQLTGGKAELVREWDATNDGKNDLVEVRYTFAAGGAVRVTMAPVVGGFKRIHPVTGAFTYDAAWMPQDWTTENGRNDRTAADLTEQYARAVYHKSVWPLYAVQSEKQRQQLVNYQLGLAASATPEVKDVWYTKFGGSSPSFRSYAVVPTDDPNACIAVFQAYGGGMTDYRTAQRITIGKENGRSVITSIEQYDMHLSFLLNDMATKRTGVTQKELFALYYETGLPWPSASEDARPDNDYNTGHFRDLMTQPLIAVQTVFAYFGESVTRSTDTGAYTSFEPWIAGATLLTQTENEADVRLEFADGSGSADVRLRKQGAYWMPFDSAWQEQGDSRG